MIDDLIPGSRYKFRIKAENDYGISDPGKESAPFDVAGGATAAAAAIDRYCDSLRQWKLDNCYIIPELKDIEVDTPGLDTAAAAATTSCANELIELPSAVNNQTLETATCGWDW